jgi:hypothetical protein
MAVQASQKMQVIPATGEIAMEQEQCKPFPAMFFCERLAHTVTRIGCVLRQHKARDLLAVAKSPPSLLCEGESKGGSPVVDAVPTSLADPRCAGCAVGEIQKQIQRMEADKEKNDNGNL